MSKTDIAFIRAFDDAVHLYTPYHPSFVSRLKSIIPNASERRWVASEKRWEVAPQHLDAVIALCQEIYPGKVKAVRSKRQNDNKVEGKIIEVHYIGTTKERQGIMSASAWFNGGWNGLFPEDVLRQWFNQAEKKPHNESHYEILCLARLANQQEIKAAFRQLARQWHPDVCREEGAHDRFIKIDRAYKILSDESLRKKYDAGLAFEESQYRRRHIEHDIDDFNVFGIGSKYPVGFRSPLRCGQVKVDGEYLLGLLIVSKIHQWSDITNLEGKTMVTSWVAGADTFNVEWV